MSEKTKNRARTNMKFITGLNFSKQMLNMANSITFIYDPNWEAGSNAEPTLPVCFFHVKSSHEIKETQVSQKPLLFYNSRVDNSNRGIKGGLVNVIADNIVLKPKQYRLDVIIPADDLSMVFGITPMNPYQMSNILSFRSDNKTWKNITGYTASVVEIIRSLSTSLAITDYSSWRNVVSGVVEGVASTPNYNKNSLEAMIDNRSILKMKMWDSWRYKYVVITNYDISKEPTENGVYEGSIVLQEVPIMTIRSDKYFDNPLGKLYKNVIVEATGKTITKTLDAMELK